MNHSPELRSEPPSCLETQLDDEFLMEMSGDAWRLTPEQDESEILDQLRRALANHAFAQHQDLSDLRSHARAVYARHPSYSPPGFAALLQRSTCNELQAANYPDDQYHQIIGRLEDILKPNLKQFLPQHQRAILHHFSPADQAPPYYTGSYINPLLDGLRKRFETWYDSFTKQSANAAQTFQLLLGNDEHRPFSMKELLAELPEAERVGLVALVQTELDAFTRLLSPKQRRQVGTTALRLPDLPTPTEPTVPQDPPSQPQIPQIQKDPPAPIMLRPTPVKPLPRVQFIPKPEPQPMPSPEPQPEPKHYRLLPSVPLPPDLVGGVKPPVLNQEGQGDLRIYLAEIHRYRLLRAEEEVSLAQRREAGMYAEKLLETWIDDDGRSTIGAGLQRELEHLACEGRMAEERLINHNLRLVKKWAFGRQQFASNIVSVSDLLQAGNRGLIEGIRRFDFTLGNKLSTYVIPWIRKEIGLELDEQLSKLSLSSDAKKEIRQLGSAELRLRETLERKPTLEELAQELNISAKRIAQLYAAIQAPLHLDQTVGAWDGQMIHEMISDRQADDPQKIAELRELRQGLNLALSILTPGQKEVVLLHFGLETKNPLSVTEVARKLGINHSSVNERLKGAMQRLQSEPVILEKLRDFLALSNED